jgi:hypothetical protein
MDTLFGQIIEALKTPEAGGDLFSVGQKKENQKAVARKIGIKMRDEILLAKRYHLGTEITKAAALLAYNVDDPIKEIIDKARVPFDSIWLEFPIAAKLQVFGLDIDKSAPQFSGVIIKRINSSPTHFIITPIGTSLFLEYKGHFVDWSPISIEVNLGQKIDANYRQKQMMLFKEPILKLAQGKIIPENLEEDNFVSSFMKATLLGGQTELSNIDDLKKLIALTEFATHRLTPYYGKLYYDAININNEVTEYSNGINHTLLEALGKIPNQQAGMFRFVLCALAILSEKEYIHIESIKPGKYRPDSILKAKMQPVYDFVTMTAPHDVFIMNKQKESNMESKREVIRHEVTGTWVNYHRTGKEDCEHAFANLDVSGNRKICMLCGRKKTWRREHERGNIELGFKKRTAKIVLDA